jgi:hypothetical protein
MSTLLVDKAGILTAQAQQFKPTLAARAGIALALALVALPWQLWQPQAYKVTVLVLVAVERTATQHPQPVEVGLLSLRRTDVWLYLIC